jgi:outer membrane protein with beta-barrel domain
MKKFAFTFLTILSLAFVAKAGTSTYSGKEMQQVAPPPCPEWYRDTEWNVGLWGTYLFTFEDWVSDEYVEADHAWGGGLDAKYFFHRYFGLGVEAWGVRAQRLRVDSLAPFTRSEDDRLIGGVLGTVTLRYPLPCSRIAPYVFGGAGVIFGGGESDFFDPNNPPTLVSHTGDSAEFLGQIGGGVEVRITPNIGVISDFSYNFVGRDNSDFGMIRTGLNFAF